MTELREKLAAGEVFVRFEKRDGSIREMRCTTNPLLIPKDKEPKNAHITVSSDQVRVYDLENKGWRSFNVNSLVSYEKN